MKVLINEPDTLFFLKTSKKPFIFIDLFAGAGGFYQENYNVLSHIEFDKYACDTIKERKRFYNYPKVEIERIKLTDIADESIIQKLNFLNVKLYQKVGFRLICLI